jgi:hypothetical protein
VVQVDRGIFCSLHDSKSLEFGDSSILWISFGPDCFKELGEKGFSYWDQVVQLRVSGIPFSRVRDSVQIVVQSCPKLELLCLDSVSLQEGDLQAIHQSMGVMRLRIEESCELVLNGETWSLALIPGEMSAEDVALLARYVKSCPFLLKEAGLLFMPYEASIDRGAFVTLLESLKASLDLDLKLTYSPGSNVGNMLGLIDLLNLVFGAPLHLRCLRVQFIQCKPLLEEQEELLAFIEEHTEIVEFDLAWPTKASAARADLSLERNLRLQWLRVAATTGNLELGDALWGKVFLCGDGYAGKSTLTKSPVRPGQASGMCWSFAAACLPRPHYYEATRGIALARYEQNGTQLVFWDLAGQKEYQVLHCSLLANEGKATSYVLVCRVEGAEEKGGMAGGVFNDPLDVRISWWLELLASYSQDASKRTVLLVFNEVGDQRLQRSVLKSLVAELRRTYSEKLDIHQEVFFLDARRRDSGDLRELRSLLVGLTQASSKPAPRICLDLQARLAKFRKGRGRFPVQTWEEFRAFMARGVVEEDLLKGTTAYLHEMGEVVYFRSGPLSGTVVSDPELFCSKFVGELLLPRDLWEPRDRRIRNQIRHGVLSIASLAEIFKEALEGSDWSAEQVVEILRGLELCDWVDETKGEVLIPALLEGSKEASDSWHGRETGEPVLGRRLNCGPEAGTVLPPGVFKVLQVRLRKRFNMEDSEFSIDGAAVSFLVDGVALLVHFDPAKAYQLSIIAKVVDGRRRVVDALDRIEELCKEVYLICAEKGVQNEHVVEKVLGGGRELEGLREMGLEQVKEKVRREGVNALSGWEAARGQFLRYSELLTTAETEGIVGELEGARLDQVDFAQEVLGGEFEAGEGAEVFQLPDGTAAEFEGDTGLRKLVVQSSEVVLKAGKQGVRTILEAGEQRHVELMAPSRDCGGGRMSS